MKAFNVMEGRLSIDARGTHGNGTRINELPRQLFTLRSSLYAPNQPLLFNVLGATESDIVFGVSRNAEKVVVSCGIISALKK